MELCYYHKGNKTWFWKVNHVNRWEARYIIKTTEVDLDRLVETMEESTGLKACRMAKWENIQSDYGPNWRDLICPETVFAMVVGLFCIGVIIYNWFFK